MTGDPRPTVAELIYHKMDTLTPSERRVGRALLANYPGAGLASAAELAAVAQTSAPTVVRFSTKIGLGGFVDLQALLRQELPTRTASPVSRAARHYGETSIAELVVNEGVRRADLIRDSLTSIPPAELEAAVTAIADDSHAVLMVGGKYSGLIARYFHLLLRDLRRNVHFLDDPLRNDLALVADIGRRDVVAVFDYRRYEPDAAALASIAKRRGCTVILFTDTWLSPASAWADVVLPVNVSSSLFDTLSAAYALVESLLPAIAQRIGQSAVERMTKVEALRAEGRAQGDLTAPDSGRHRPAQRST
ncbi:MAG: MurR/RpiR family transcriptional regulator [Modestobacter sp.]|jgi:DNA-binding MurR/RpiR family transcriptional regulator|nr:MurR/RpiR family transcriptional regulator [Modestobacter sp.]